MIEAACRPNQGWTSIASTCVRMCSCPWHVRSLFCSHTGQKGRVQPCPPWIIKKWSWFLMLVVAAGDFTRRLYSFDEYLCGHVRSNTDRQGGERSIWQPCWRPWTRPHTLTLGTTKGIWYLVIFVLTGRSLLNQIDNDRLTEKAPVRTSSKTNRSRRRVFVVIRFYGLARGENA